VTPAKRRGSARGAGSSRDGRRTRAKRRRAAETGGPRYQQVANELIDGIGGGIYPVGGLLPTEMELCEQYNISRSTVREALRKLRDI